MKVKAGFFDNIDVDLAEDCDPSDPALQKFLALGPKDRAKAARHVYAYYKDFHSAVGGDEWRDQEVGVPAGPADIWAFVTPGPVFVQQDAYGDKPWYVVMEAECAWEDEHGLMLVWRNGETLSKVSGFDGHVTNANAYDDDKLLDVVYRASDPAWTTRLDP